MKLTTQSKPLQKLLTHCAGVADKKSTIPILGNVLLQSTVNGLRVSATDLFLSVSDSTEAEVDSGGSVSVGARDLLDRVKTMPDGPVNLSVNDKCALTIRAGGSARRFTLHGVPGEEFPKLPAIGDDAVVLSLPAALLLRLINATHFCVSTDETRPHLNSAFFEWGGGLVRVVATDGHRLAKIETELAGANDAPQHILIPNKGVQELKKFCSEVDGESTIKITRSGAEAFFDIGPTAFSVKTVDAKFPPYQSVIPDGSERVFSLPCDAVASAVRAVSVAASDRTGGIRMTMATNVARFSSEAPETGDGLDEVPVDYDLGEFTVGLNAKYILDVLTAVESDEVEFGASGKLDPVVIRDGEFLGVIMPMRI